MHSSKIEYVHVYVQEIICSLTRRFAVGKLDNEHWSYWLFLLPSPPGPPRPQTTRVRDGCVGPCFDHGPSRCPWQWRIMTVAPNGVIFDLAPLLLSIFGTHKCSNIPLVLSFRNYPSVLGIITLVSAYSCVFVTFMVSVPSSCAVIIQYPF